MPSGFVSEPYPPAVTDQFDVRAMLDELPANVRREYGLLSNGSDERRSAGAESSTSSGQAQVQDAETFARAGAPAPLVNPHPQATYQAPAQNASGIIRPYVSYQGNYAVSSANYAHHFLGLGSSSKAYSTNYVSANYDVHTLAPRVYQQYQQNQQNGLGNQQHQDEANFYAPVKTNANVGVNDDGHAHAPVHGDGRHEHRSTDWSESGPVPLVAETG